MMKILFFCILCCVLNTVVGTHGGPGPAGSQFAISFLTSPILGKKNVLLRVGLLRFPFTSSVVGRRVLLSSSGVSVGGACITNFTFLFMVKKLTCLFSKNRGKKIRGNCSLPLESATAFFLLSPLCYSHLDLTTV